MPEKSLHDQISEEIEASIKARLEAREAVANLAATLDRIRDLFANVKREDKDARVNVEDMKK